MDKIKVLHEKIASEDQQEKNMRTYMKDRATIFVMLR